jgi:hypothetical protein
VSRLFLLHKRSEARIIQAEVGLEPHEADAGAEVRGACRDALGCGWAVEIARGAPAYSDPRDRSPNDGEISRESF